MSVKKLPEDLTTPQPNVVINKIYNNGTDPTYRDQSVLNTTTSKKRYIQTPGPAKNIMEVWDLIQKAIRNYETRQQTEENKRLKLTCEYPDFTNETESITFAIGRREPGGTGPGRPFEQDVKNYKRVQIEEYEDLENPGYKTIVHRRTYDNVIVLTCWAKTRYQANQRMLWLESLMIEYGYYFQMSGVPHLFFLEGNGEKVIEVNNNKLYGKPLSYFVKTEALTKISSKAFEQLIIELSKEDI